MYACIRYSGVSVHVCLYIILIKNIAEYFFADILNGYQPCSAAVLVKYNRHCLLLGMEFFFHLSELRCFKHEERFTQIGAYLKGVAFVQVFGRKKEVFNIEETLYIIDIRAVYREA